MPDTNPDAIEALKPAAMAEARRIIESYGFDMEVLTGAVAAALCYAAVGKASWLPEPRTALTIHDDVVNAALEESSK